jgi:hypothetical protein
LQAIVLGITSTHEIMVFDTGVVYQTSYNGTAPGTMRKKVVTHRKVTLLGCQSFNCEAPNEKKIPNVKATFFSIEDASALDVASAGHACVPINTQVFGPYPSNLGAGEIGA